jgi:hypothetical protein
MPQSPSPVKQLVKIVFQPQYLPAREASTFVAITLRVMSPNSQVLASHSRLLLAARPCYI